MNQVDWLNENEMILWNEKSSLKYFFVERDKIVIPFLFLCVIWGIIFLYLADSFFEGLCVLLLVIIPIIFLLINRFYIRYKKRIDTEYWITTERIIISYHGKFKCIRYSDINWYQPEVREDKSGSIYFERKKGLWEINFFGNNSFFRDEWLGIVEVPNIISADKVIRQKMMC